MRAFYTNSLGQSADLCQYIGRDTTRLIVRNPNGNVIYRKEFSTWSDAAAAMNKLSDRWENELLKRRG